MMRCVSSGIFWLVFLVIGQILRGPQRQRVEPYMKLEDVLVDPRRDGPVEHPARA